MGVGSLLTWQSFHLVELGVSRVSSNANGALFLGVTNQVGENFKYSWKGGFEISTYF